ncbi:conserved hypothetical protein [Histoplasma capsulatum G186AR]|uniref:DASH complex subunit SPC34 n=2 Tax=Ajellomyces capsulatus TaxID=5037 RepID=C0NXS4_AJECG|nr:uncharacterized protein HCBG_07718 [Histoplasma capsulatum G186AR]EEH03592.1 conserved hypothetical protein [Histoplasma capsulatum G186AR]KAG5293835.1 DASH_Spc34 superfamily domain-containing protein [Histoplasma capsulatum]QSS75287.1 DASH_Spc34 superfamily domain-containing protein [Histoplasma capsulatum G186AR]
MGLLESHLEQISLSATAIADLPFPPPKIFANAMLGPHDITTLIRDTEPHERALFSIDPSANSQPRVTSASSANSQRRTTRRVTTAASGSSFPDLVLPLPHEGGDSMASRIYAAKHNKSQSAVTQVLGGDMVDEIKKPRGEVDVKVLLRGAEMLCNVYPIPGAQEQISTLRHRHEHLSASIAHLESRIAEQAAQLQRMNRSQDYSSDYDPAELETSTEVLNAEVSPHVTEEDLRREILEIHELEARKQKLEERMTGMERDLGELMR